MPVAVETEPKNRSLSTATVRNPATTKSIPRRQGISLRWPVKIRQWVRTSGVYRGHRRLTHTVGDRWSSFADAGPRGRTIPPEPEGLPILHGVDDDEGVVRLRQTGAPDGYRPGLSMRFTRTDEKAIRSFPVGTLVPDALGMLESVEIGRYG